MTIGIIGAMPEEIEGLLSLVEDVSREDFGMRTYFSGKLSGQNVVAVLSRIGKVATASTATTLIDRYKVKKIIFTGVAGAVSENLKIGDVVVADTVLQHDMDASAVMDFKKYEIPLLNKIKFECDPVMTERALTAAAEYIRTHPNYSNASVHRGLIASGDRFIHSPGESQRLTSEIEGLLAVEMEGGALGQICYEWGVPFCMVRSISDNANHTAVVDFPKFVKDFAAPFSVGIINNLLSGI